MEVRSIGKEQAIKFHETKWWEGCSPAMIAFFQLFTKELCCPFDIFHAAVEELVERSVWTHEFGSDGIEALRSEAIEKLMQGRTR